MNRHISVIGLGPVGLCSAVCYAVKGNKVKSFDLDKRKLKLISQGIPPFYEPDLEPLLKKAIYKRKLEAVNSNEAAVLGSDITFITVGTPALPNGNIDVKSLRACTEQIGKALKSKKGYHLIVVKSTVVPGSTERVIKPLLEKNSQKVVGLHFGLVVNPEFLREGSAVQDILCPKRIVIGEFDEYSGRTLEGFYKELHGEKVSIVRTNPATAEMIKYANNAFLATKISFINQIANICERMSERIDVKKVAQGIGMDSRINPEFLNAGVGWGGSCFPKDLMALVAFSRQMGYEPKILEDVLLVNSEQARRVVDVLKGEIGSLEGKKIAILGLSFKPGTDDVRQAASIRVINHLLQEGSDVSAYDPVAINNAKEVLGTKAKYSTTIADCLYKADGCILVTEWEEFKRLNPEDFVKLMRTAFLFDGRRIYDPEEFSKKLRFRAVGLSRRRESR